MKQVKDTSKGLRHKRKIEKNLKFHLNFIEKKLSDKDLISALNKCESALTLIKENQKLGLKEYFNKFTAISNLINQEISEMRKSYEIILEKMRYAKITQENLEEVLRKYVKIKNQIAQEKNHSLLEDLNQNIDLNLEFIKKCYGLIGIYDILNYDNVIESIYSLIWKTKSENLINFRRFFEEMQNALIKLRINEIGTNVEKISIFELSDKCLVDEYQLEHIIREMVRDENSLVKVFVENSKIVVFKKTENEK